LPNYTSRLLADRFRASFSWRLTVLTVSRLFYLTVQHGVKLHEKKDATPQPFAHADALYLFFAPRERPMPLSRQQKSEQSNRR